MNKELTEIRHFCRNSDKEDVYMRIYSDEQEIERLKTELQDTKEHLGEYLHEQEEENKRLNNIINELEKDLYDRYYARGKYHMDSGIIGIKDVLDKLQELKGSDKE